MEDNEVIVKSSGRSVLLDMDDDNTTNNVPSFEQWMAFYNETVTFERKIGIIIPSIFALIIVVGVPQLSFPEPSIATASLHYEFRRLANGHISAYCSVWTLTLMALDRYLAVVYPVDSLTLRSPKNTIIALVVIYTIIVATQIPVGLMHGIYTYDFIIEERSTCAIVSIATNNATQDFVRTYFITFNVFGYILPLGISVLLYWRMLRRLWDTPRPGHSNTMNGSIRSRPETRRAKRKVTRLVLCVLIIWAVCWLPLNVCFFVSGFIRVICTMGRKLTMGAYCIQDDKQTRMEFTTCNNTTTSNSIKRFQATPRAAGKAFSERSLLLRDRPNTHKRAFEMAQFSRTPSSKSFNL
ncbi:7 transmembrane receptor [Teladorsagia circumcincta]|uniref:7 transmembrane receptor n=1 Tax=Teladorsagia circumcincta TaxID=45464 RepID=A0A2G9V048_TELCI|nr:7 transmembrane receptor [Teladorsagia circumcincta]